MSSSAIATRVPVGQATMHAFHARAKELVGQRQDLVQRRVSARRAEFAARGIGAAERLGELAGRCDAVAGLVPERELSQVREALQRIADQGEPSGTAASRIEKLEQRAERVAAGRLRKEVLLEEVVAANGGKVLGEVDWAADGSSSATVSFPGDVTIQVTLDNDSGAEDEADLISWHTADSNIASQAAVEGAIDGCEAELRFVEEIAAAYPGMCLDERSRAEAEAAAVAEIEEEEEGGWGEMSAG